MEWIDIIENPNLLLQTPLEKIEKGIEEYPYWRALHSLKLKKIKLNGDKWQLQLTDVASKVEDRAALKAFLDLEIKASIVNDSIIIPINSELEETEKLPTSILKEEKEVSVRESSGEGNVLKKTSEVQEIVLDETKDEIKTEELTESIIKEETETTILSESRLNEQEEAEEQLPNDFAEYPIENTPTLEEKEIDLTELKFIPDPKEILLKLPDISSLRPKSRPKNQFINKTIKEEVEKVVETDGKNSFLGWLSELKNEEETKSSNSKDEFEDKNFNNLLEQDQVQEVEIKAYVEDLASQSIRQEDEFVTETLAKLYIAQGKKSKAIKIYQKLSLKFPEKSGYFAIKIKEIK